VTVTCDDKGKKWAYRIIKENMPMAFSKETFDTRLMANAYAVHGAIECLERFYTQEGLFN
jgi:hypothetical protein